MGVQTPHDTHVRSDARQEHAKERGWGAFRQPDRHPVRSENKDVVRTGDWRPDVNHGRHVQHDVEVRESPLATMALLLAGENVANDPALDSIRAASSRREQVSLPCRAKEVAVPSFYLAGSQSSLRMEVGIGVPP